MSGIFWNFVLKSVFFHNRKICKVYSRFLSKIRELQVVSKAAFRIRIKQIRF
jgi:hypothetical protein